MVRFAHHLSHPYHNFRNLKRIIVYADLDFLSTPAEIGTLDYEQFRDKDHFAFEFLANE